MRLSQFENKYKATISAAKDGNAKPKVIFAPDVAKLQKELFGKSKQKSKNLGLDLSLDKQRQRGYNDVLPEKKDVLVPTGIDIYGTTFQVFQ